MKKFLLSLFFIFFSTAINAAIINEVLIKNNNRISKETIITYGKIQIGKNYNDQDLNNILKNL